ncbi:alpha-N-acetylgalactosaminidase-like [Heteronotia binoei]|uniref:alpha-N-acetylgalactosaminidase-like n=1 Tax=Heteronotia binoei TaxID=13085 RepID=UPI00293019BA|nr:alpha-N-acetylgalactosaminidase-like [Heteronotia binoei]
MALLPLMFVLGLLADASSLDNGLLRTPPMGWVPWEHFRCNTDCEKEPDNCISERLIKMMVDRLAEDGWKELGYKYVNLDDCWAAKERDSLGRLQANASRFPSGIKALADYVHAKGLKFGIYSDLGNLTCEGYPGTTLDTIETDAKTFAEWGVDMLKLDGCFSNSSARAAGYPKMSAALNKTGRWIVYSCSWPAYEGGLPPKVNYTLLGQICNLWRNFGDIEDSWGSLSRIIKWYGDHQDTLQPAAGPGRWNDPDMLLVGNSGLSLEQAKVQLALWAILAAPLFMSCNLRTISAEARDLLRNPLLIYIDQDPLGVPGRRIAKSGQFEVWKRGLVDHQYGIAVLNNGTGQTPRPFVTSLDLLHILDCKTGYKIYNVLDRSFLGEYRCNATLSFTVAPTGVVLLFLRPLS